MDMNGLFSMLTRMFLRKAVNTGIRHMASKGKPRSEMTPHERQEAASAKAMADRARKATRIGRRLFK